MNRYLQGQYAGAVTRTLAFLVDIAIIIVVIAVFSWLANATFTLIGVDLQNCKESTLFGNWSVAACAGVRVGLAIFAGLFAPVYALFFWTAGGQTIGDAVMGIRVVRTDGKGLTLVNSLRRLVGFLLCLLTLGLGFALMLVDNQRQGLHDNIAGTFVIYAWRGELNTESLGRVQAWLARRSNKSTSPAPR